MKSKMRINKRGSYLVEATIALPVFLVAVLVMSSIVLMYACIEDAGFIGVNEMRKAAIEARVIPNDPLLPGRIGEKVARNHAPLKSYRTKEYGFRETRGDMDELICLKLTLFLKTENPLDFASKAEYDFALATRAYVGKVRKQAPMSVEQMESDKEEAVFVFPKRGKKYHNKACRHMKAKCTPGTKTKELTYRYDPCPICGSKKAKLGETVYYFPVEGEVYHLSGCRVMNRNYVELSKAVAEERGYRPCETCGG